MWFATIRKEWVAEAGYWYDWRGAVTVVVEKSSDGSGVGD